MANIDTIDGMISEANHFYRVVRSTPADYQTTEDQAATLLTLVTAASAALEERTATENVLITKRSVFKSAFKDLSDFFRKLRQSVKDNPATTDLQRSELHLDPTTDETDDDRGMETAPLIVCDSPGVHQTRVRFFVAGEKSTSTKKPKGSMGSKIFLKIGGEASTNLKEYSLITLDTKQPYIFDHEAEDAGKTAHFIALWVDDDGGESPQSEVFSTVIT